MNRLRNLQTDVQIYVRDLLVEKRHNDISALTKAEEILILALRASLGRGSRNVEKRLDSDLPGPEGAKDAPVSIEGRDNGSTPPQNGEIGPSDDGADAHE